MKVLLKKKYLQTPSKDIILYYYCFFINVLNLFFRSMKKELLQKHKFNYLGTRYNIKISKIQNHLLKSLKEVHADTERHLINFKLLSQNLQKDLVNKDHVEEQMNISEAHMKQLEIMLYRERIEITTSNYIRKRIQCKIKKCRETLYDVKYAVICALQV